MADAPPPADATPPASVRDLLRPDGAVARRLDGYEERPQQLELATAVESALRDRHHLVAEAGTGVGKSFAYLLPAVLHADRNQGRGPVIVSTRTIALQQQLDTQDLPFLRAVLPIEFSAVTAVGRNNYLCLRRMHNAEKDRGVFEDRRMQSELERVVGWSMDTREGTRMDLPRTVDELVWEEVRAESGNCLHRACPHFDPCHYQRGRRRMGSAQILVVNHSLYMADLALRMAGTSYLPDHEVVIFDEAHHLERVATESLGLRFAPTTVGWHLRRLYSRKNRNSLLARYGTPQSLVLVREAWMLAEQFFADLQQRLDASGSRDGIALHDEVLVTPLNDVLVALAEEVTTRAASVTKVDHKMELMTRASGLQSLNASVRRLCRPDADGMVRWIEPGRRGPSLRAAPLDVSQALREHLFQRTTAILTSATMGPAEDDAFSWLRNKLGIDEADTARLGSPFDYKRNVEIVLEEAMPDPAREASSFLEESAERIERHVVDNAGRALVLCTSWAAVRRLSEALAAPLATAGIELLVQGEQPLTRLLERKREAPCSVLVGTDSLWEGIDLRGDALTLVIVTRLPFANPGHPLTVARMRAIQQRGGQPFADHSLPEAVLRFRQGIGRLIRSSTDRGRIVVLDPRIRSKPYGRNFLRALPETAQEPL